MRHWIGSALVQITPGRLIGAEALSKPMLCYCQLNLRNKFQLNLNQNTKLSIHKNASENIICEMGVILSRRRWVNSRSTNAISQDLVAILNIFFQSSLFIFRTSTSSQIQGSVMKLDHNFLGKLHLAFCLLNTKQSYYLNQCYHLD